MIPMIEREVVDRRKWFEREDFINQFTLAQSAPGPFSLNAAVFVGYKMRGWLGAFVSVVALVIPSFVIIVLIAIYLTDVKDNEVINSAFTGMRPAIVALIAFPFIQMMKGFKYWQILIAIGVSVAIWALGFSPIYFVFAGALIGILITLFRKR